MTRTLAHSLQNICKKNGWDFKLSSLYDNCSDVMPQYVTGNSFKGYNNSRLKFVCGSLYSARKPDIIILSHINLALIGLIISYINPKCRVWLIAHGIEIWRPLPYHKRLLLKKCHKVICVSKFTKDQVIARHHIKPEVCEILNNAVDPFMKLPKTFTKPDYLLKRYGLTPANHVIFTLSRLAYSEQYKGHDMVIKAISRLKDQFADIKYVLAGQYDTVEELRIKKLITYYKVSDQVILTGFINEQEFVDHFLMADLFVLPSKKEGFGIVFIEALACGLPVICGNADGSVDAILNGKLGTAINTDNEAELEKAIIDNLTLPLTISRRQHLQDKCLQNFSEQNYIDKLTQLLIDEPTG